jgi:hypothetical protein
VSISALIGTFIRMQAGYAGGWLDNVLMQFTEVIMTWPVLFARHRPAPSTPASVDRRDRSRSMPLMQ